MLAISLLAGWRVGGPTLPVLALSVAVLAAFLAQASWLEWRAGRVHAFVPALEAFVGVAAFIVAVVIDPAFLLTGGAVAVVGVVAGLLRVSESGTAGRVRLQAWSAHFAGAIALGGIAPLLSSHALPPIETLRLWIGVGGSFVAGILLVRSLRDVMASSAPLLVWCIATAAMWWIVGTGPEAFIVALAWSPIPLRWLGTGFLRRRRVGWRTLGLLETGLGAWSALWTVVSLS